MNEKITPTTTAPDAPASEITVRCKCCGRELPLRMFRMSGFGRQKTCIECVAKKAQAKKVQRQEIEQLKSDVDDARKLRIQDFQPRELMAELKRRGYEWADMIYTEVRRVNFKDI